MDAAICDESAAGFAQWNTHLYNKMTGKKWDIQGMGECVFVLTIWSCCLINILCC